MFSRQQYGDAIDVYQKAIDRAPDNFEPYFGQCGAYLFAGRYPDAVKSCNRSIELEPTAYSYIEPRRGVLGSPAVSTGSPVV